MDLFKSNTFYHEKGVKELIPNLFIIGAPKCGTTTLFEYLNNHEEIVMSEVKEPAFFDKDHLFSGSGEAVDKGWHQYLRLFYVGDSICYKWVGEATTFYLAHPAVPYRIRVMCGENVKIIVCLRDPVRRAYSHYWHAVREGVEMRLVEEALVDEHPDSVHDTGLFPKYYLVTGRYWIHLKRYINEFGARNVLVLKFEELVEKPQEILRKVWQFLGVEDQKQITHIKANPSMLPRSFMLQSYLSIPHFSKELIKFLVPSKIRQKLVHLVRQKNLRPAKYPPMDRELKVKLGEYYYEDNLQLKNNFGFDIAGWTSCDGGVFEVAK